MAELITGLLEAIIALLKLIVEGIAFLLSGASTLLIYACSKRFRERKVTEWKHHKLKKFAELGFSGICLASLIVMGAWLLLPDAKPQEGQVTAFEIEKPRTGEDARLKLHIRTDDNGGEDVIIAIKEGGAAKILETKTVEDLTKQIAENVSVVSEQKTSETNSRPDQKSASR